MKKVEEKEETCVGDIMGGTNMICHQRLFGSINIVRPQRRQYGLTKEFTHFGEISWFMYIIATST